MSSSRTRADRVSRYEPKGEGQWRINMTPRPAQQKNVYSKVSGRLLEPKGQAGYLAAPGASLTISCPYTPAPVS